MLQGFGEFRSNFWKLIFGAALLFGVDVFLGLRFGWEIGLAVLLIVAVWAAWQGWQAAAGYRTAYHQQLQQTTGNSLIAHETLLAVQERLRQTENRRVEGARRLRMLMLLNRGLSEAQDESSLMDFALSSLTALVGALGCSFVPVDEWDQPMPAFTYGQLPEPVLRAWANHLASHMLQDRCAQCRLLVGPPGECPLHPAEAGDALRVYCVQLDRPTVSSKQNNGQNNRLSAVTDVEYQADSGTRHRLGVLHLYMPPGKIIDADLRVFLEGLVQEIAVAYVSARLRSQEVTTLRQIQLLHASQNDFYTSLGSLLGGLKLALEADCVLIRLRASSDERFSNLNIQSGNSCGINEAQIEQVFNRVLTTSTADSMADLGIDSPPGTLPVWVALPLVLPESQGKSAQGGAPSGQVLGMLLAGCTRPYEFHPRQKAILQTVATQAALLIENERMIRSLEYKVVIQERARLAREIHDGLAQTLAYLKLQAAQMQSYLAQGDTARLSQVLKENYRALTEAYLDTRQAIDNLRLTPKEGLDSWLERILSEFENSTGVEVQRSLNTLHRLVTPEVQAHLIRIMQEALSNVRKHARARMVRVSLYELQGDLVLEVKDNGLGFDAGDVPEISRHGLRGMRERAEMIGADFQIISQANQGTTVRLVLPVALEEETSQ